MTTTDRTTTTITPEGHLVITRTFNAPRAAVWKAWTDPVHFAKWWGPKDYTAPSIKMDVRPGGRYHWCMRGSDGQEFWSTGTYTEVTPIERLVYTDSFADPEGNAVSAAYYGMEGDFGPEQFVTLTFEEIGAQTRMTLRHAGLPKGQWGELASAGWNESFDKLEASL